MLIIDDETIGRQLALGDNAYSRQRNCQYERPVQTGGRNFESYADNRQDVDAQKAVQTEGSTPDSSTNKRHDVDTQSQHNADVTTKPSVITNPMVMGNNNNENIFLSELIISENQNFVSQQLREGDTVTNIKQAGQRDNNSSEIFISDQSKKPWHGGKNNTN